MPVALMNKLIFKCALTLTLGWLALSMTCRAAETALNNRALLGIQGAQFTLNGRPTFLLGISYYGALSASEEVWRQDLADIKRYGFNWIRVWATWNSFSN